MPENCMSEKTELSQISVHEKADSWRTVKVSENIDSETIKRSPFCKILLQRSEGNVRREDISMAESTELLLDFEAAVRSNAGTNKMKAKSVSEKKKLPQNLLCGPQGRDGNVFSPGWKGRIEGALRNEMLEMANAVVKDAAQVGDAEFDPIETRRMQDERKRIRSMQCEEKLKKENERMVVHRGRVFADGLRMERAEALLRFGYSPGERTLSDDWQFWHGFEVEMKGDRVNTQRSRRNAEHGCGCGGSKEWIASLKQHRSEINKKIAARSRGIKHAGSVKNCAAPKAFVRGHAEKQPNSGVDTMKAWKKQKKFQKLEFPKAVQNPKRCNGSKTQKKSNAMKRSLCKRKNVSVQPIINVCRSLC